MLINRIWAMPNKWTFTIKPIKELIIAHKTGVWIDPFCGLHSPAEHKNDLNPDIPAESHTDALCFLKNIPTEHFDGVFYDPPYSITQATECYKSFGKDKLIISVASMGYWAAIKDEMQRIIKKDGKAICCGWSSMGLGKGRGFEMIEVLLVPHGGSKNDTIVTVEQKIK